MFGVTGNSNESNQKQVAIHMVKSIRGGEKALEGVELLTEILYGTNSLKNKNANSILNACENAGMEIHKIKRFKEKTITEFLLHCKLVSSKNEAKRLENGISLNGEKISSVNSLITPENNFLNEKVAIFRIGKTKWGIIEITL